MNQLYPFQQQAVDTLTQRKHTLLADECGLGKTVQAIKLMSKIPPPILIICKASIKENWKRKLEEWLDYAFLYGYQIINKKTDVLDPGANIIIVNYDLISHSHIFYQLANIKWQLLICDEAHYLKNMKAIRTKTILSRKGLIHHTERSLMMTGTPVLNRPIELYPMLKVLSPETIAPYNDYYKFAKRFCNGHQDGFCFNDKGASHTDDLNKRLRAGFMIRRTYKEVEMQLPQRRFEMVVIEQSENAKPLLTILENAERLDFKHQKLGVEAGELATLRQKTALEKVELCLDKIKEYVESVDKLVIFAYHKAVIEKLLGELHHYGTVIVTGATPTKDRQSVIDSFIRNSKLKVFIGQIDAAGEGIDMLQTVCHNILFVESSWVPGTINQAIARVWRLGQSHPVLVRFLIWANSVEEHQMRVALDKVKTIKEITK